MLWLAEFTGAAESDTNLSFLLVPDVDLPLPVLSWWGGKYHFAKCIGLALPSLL